MTHINKPVMIPKMTAKPQLVTRLGLAKGRFSRGEFEEYPKTILSDQMYLVIKYQDPDSCITDYLKKEDFKKKWI